MTQTVREATPGDAAEITAIYNEGIAGRQATFDTEPCSVEDIAADLRADMATHPTMAVVADGLGGDVDADAVAGQDGDVKGGLVWHGVRFLLACV